jgi:AcrR family transcriptional regulator
MGKAEETRQLIIERSAPIFNKKGIAATAMSDIMEATNLSKGSLYVHFENKDVLAETVVDYNMELLTKKVMAAINRYDNPREKLFAYIDTFKNPLNPPVPGGCPMMNFGVEADDMNEGVRVIVARVVEMSQQLIIDIIKQGVSQGIFKPDWNYREFATLMFAMIEGGVMISRTTQKTDKMGVISRHLKKMIEEQQL